MTIDDSNVGAWREMQKRNRPPEPQLPLHGGGGGGIYDGMESRVTRLEVLAETARDELRDHRAEFRVIRAEMQAEFKTINTRLAELPTKSDLNTWQWQWLAGGLAIVALMVGGVTGGLALIAHYAG